MYKASVLFKRAEAKPYDMTSQGGQKGTSYKVYVLTDDGKDVVLKANKDLCELYAKTTMVQGEMIFTFETGRGYSTPVFLRFEEN